MERVFLHALTENPRDHVNRAVYADWLEENQPESAASKVQFLRTTAQWAQLAVDDEHRPELEQRLQDLAASLPNAWLAVVSCLPVENCHAHEKTLADLRRESPFYFLCDRQWEDLRPTDSDTVRFCDACREKVYFCSSLARARRHGRAGHCVALLPDRARREGDIAPPDRRTSALLGGIRGGDVSEPHDEEEHPTPLRREVQRHRSVTEQRRRQGRTRGE